MPEASADSRTILSVSKLSNTDGSWVTEASAAALWTVESVAPCSMFFTARAILLLKLTLGSGMKSSPVGPCWMRASGGGGNAPFLAKMP